MAHFAELDENSVVTRVIVVGNQDILDANGNESEAVGIAFCQNLLGGNWKQTMLVSVIHTVKISMHLFLRNHMQAGF